MRTPVIEKHLRSERDAQQLVTDTKLEAKLVKLEETLAHRAALVHARVVGLR